MPTATKEKMKFKLLRGSHTSGNQHNGDFKSYHARKVINSDQNLDNDATDIIETDKNLAKLFGSDKFQRIYENDPNSDGLDDMNKDRLLEIAEENEIDLESGLKKQDIIEAIRSVV